MIHKLRLCLGLVKPKRLLCFIGIHHWRYQLSSSYALSRICNRCKAKQEWTSEHWFANNPYHGVWRKLKE